MHPELFRIPFTDMTVKSYGFMLVVGFLSAIFIIRRLSRKLGDNPEHITNAALYSLITGIIGARLFYVIHYWQNFRDNPIEVFFVWHGGLELLGGVIPAIAVIILYLRSKRLPIKRYMDILAIGLTIALAFGRIGCLLNGCCYGKPAELPWSITFPYGSLAYNSQTLPDPDRNRPQAIIELPSDFYFNYYDKNGDAVKVLVPYAKLTSQQKHYLLNNHVHRCLPVHPTQIYSSINALLIFMILYLFWRRGSKLREKDVFPRIHNPGTTFSLMFILYGPTRFFIETLRDDNPYEMAKLTVSQIIGIVLFVLGFVLFLIFANRDPQHD